jgi:hypothetical protein
VNGVSGRDPVHGTDSSAGALDRATHPRTALTACIDRHQHRWSKEDPAANALRGQRGLRARFIREAFEAEPGITDAEAERRAEHAYKAHMARLAFASSKARSRKASDAPAT